MVKKRNVSPKKSSAKAKKKPAKLASYSFTGLKKHKLIEYGKAVYEAYGQLSITCTQANPPDYPDCIP